MALQNISFERLQLQAQIQKQKGYIEKLRGDITDIVQEEIPQQAKESLLMQKNCQLDEACIKLDELETDLQLSQIS